MNLGQRGIGVPAAPPDASWVNPRLGGLGRQLGAVEQASGVSDDASGASGERGERLLEVAIEVVRAWAPIGADRFYNLVRHGYYDDARFHRTVPDFIVQWGLAGDPEVTGAWIGETIPDDDAVVASNVRGTIAFAFTEPHTRTTQVYINLLDNSRLDAQGFPPFVRVVEGMEVVDRIYPGYGESSGGGLRRGEQSAIVAGGNDYLDREFPMLTRLLRATVERGSKE